MPNKNRIGNLGEDIACKYLNNRGFKILERNYWKSQGEIDIIAEKNNSIHFVEVKSVSWNLQEKNPGNQVIRPEENLHKNKLRKLFRAVQIYLIERKISENSQWQIDAIFVFVDQNHKRSAVEFYEHISLE